MLFMIVYAVVNGNIWLAINSFRFDDTLQISGAAVERCCLLDVSICVASTVSCSGICAISCWNYSLDCIVSTCRVEQLFLTLLLALSWAL